MTSGGGAFNKGVVYALRLPLLEITTPRSLPYVSVDTPYIQALVATNGTLPYTWSVVSNSLPIGLTLVPSTGAITGTPTVATTANFRVRVTDAASLTAEKDFTLTVNLLVNGSFETPVMTNATHASVDGWQGPSAADASQVLRRGNDYGIYPLDREQQFNFNGGDAAPGNYIEQTFSTTSGTVYHVAFGVGRSGGTTDILQIHAELFDSNAVQIGSLYASPPTTDGWAMVSFNFVADSNSTRLRFTDTSGSNPSSDLHLDAVAVIPATLWSGATDLGGGWKRLAWFGDFVDYDGNWIWHSHHGWLYTTAIDTSSIWFWDNSKQRWWWTSASVYPFLYLSDGANSTWLWYYTNTSFPRWLHNYRIANIEWWP